MAKLFKNSFHKFINSTFLVLFYFQGIKSGGDHMTTMAIQQSYRELNRYLNWKTDEDGFYKGHQPHDA